jgi:predicted outer membrane protein
MKRSHILSAGALAALALVTSAASAQVTDTTKKTGYPINPPPAIGNQVTPAVGDADIARQLIEANRKEVEEARAAQTQGQSSRVKSLAQRLDRDHSKAADDLEAWLAKKGGAVGAGMPNGMAHDSAKMNADSARLGRDNNKMGDTSRVAIQGNDTMKVSQGNDSMNVTPPAANAGQGQNPEFAGKTGKEFDKAWVEALEDEHKEAISNLRDNIIPRIQDSELKTLVQNMLPTMGNHLRDLETLEGELK